MGGELALFRCGPVTLRLTAAEPALFEQTVAELSLYAGEIPQGQYQNDSELVVGVDVAPATYDAGLGAGDFLRSRAMHVDKTAAGLVATCRSGAWGLYSAERRQWHLMIPARHLEHDRDSTEDINLEDLLELVLTTAWRQAGWIPLHAGAVVNDGRCVLLTAASRGGKTTLTAALLHLGWRTLGDDKLLLRLGDDGRPQLRFLQRHFNIDPQTRQWFPEVGDLSHLPLDSIWTPKRRADIEAIWPGRLLAEATPTHLVQIRRHPDPRPAQAQALGPTQTLSALLRQTVVPNDPALVKAILSVVAPTARRLQGLQLELGDDAYRDRRTLDTLEQMLA